MSACALRSRITVYMPLNMQVALISAHRVNVLLWCVCSVHAGLAPSDQANQSLKVNQTHKLENTLPV